MALFWRARATLDLEDIRPFIASDNPRAAAQVVSRFRSATARLLQFPQRGRTGVVPGTLELVIPGLPYIIVYRLAGKDTEIVTVVHGARRREVLVDIGKSSS
jgi:toxin ParE1/3/4